MSKVTKSVVVKGRVQGVFYRASTRDEARKMGLTGWVKNVSNGDVEILVSGEDEMVQQFLAWCKEGPQLASVDQLIVEDTVDQEFASFEVIY